MTTETGSGRWDRVKALFGAALDYPEARRDAFIESACGEDASLRHEVEALLEAHHEAGSFLSEPAVASASDVDVSTDELVEDDVEGRHIGPYRLLSVAGRGGMGFVYRAVRDDDVFQKTVALKLIPGGADADARRRFSQERRILARLQHPNVAGVMDGGTSDEGQPYLVMEYVEGDAMDDYCERTGLSVRERLVLFRKVCDTVHYAHQNLIVHRDLKPENILVTAEGEPKLLDFGIAKLVASGDDGSMATATLSRRMTAAYASPEQVRGAAVTTASEVYSLGVVLYELLTGRLPYTFHGSSFEDRARAVCDEEELPLPSAAARRSDTPLARARARELAGDLDTIVSKAMRKEPERRYPSAQALSDDLGRYLDGLPVLARGDTFAYRASKLARRHWAGVAAAGLVSGSLVLGFAATFWQWRRAEANRVRAEARLADVRALANAFLFELHDAIANLPGSTSARQLVVARAAEYLDRLAADAPGDVSLKRELASAYQRLGEAQGGAGDGNLGDTAGALLSYEKALSLRRALLDDPGTLVDVEGMAQLEMKLSRLHVVSGDWERAESTALASAERMASIAGRTEHDLRSALATTYHTLGFIQSRRGADDRALASLRKAVVESASYAGAHPEERGARANLARIQTDLVEQLVRRAEVEEASPLAESSWRILEELVEAEPHNARYRRDLIYVLNVGSGAIESAGDLVSANRARRRSLEEAQSLLEADPRNFGDQVALTYCLHYLGAGLIRSGEIEDGLARMSEAVSAARAAARSHPSAFTRGRVAEIQAERATALDLDAHARERCAALSESVTIWEELETTGELPGEVRSDFEAARSQLSACSGLDL